MSTQIIPYNPSANAPLADTIKMAEIFVKSGYFADSRDMAQGVTKIIAGAELGFPPIASMTGIYIVKGKVSLSANLIAAAIKRSGRYTYKVLKLEATECSINFLERNGDQWQSLGVSTFTADDARKAGTQNMNAFPRNMLFARAMSNGAKWYCPDIFGGPVYTPEELGASVNEDGEVIDSTATVPARMLAATEPATVIPPTAAASTDSDRDWQEQINSVPQAGRVTPPASNGDSKRKPPTIKTAAWAALGADLAARCPYWQTKDKDGNPTGKFNGDHAANALAKSGTWTVINDANVADAMQELLQYAEAQQQPAA